MLKQQTVGDAVDNAVGNGNHNDINSVFSEGAINNVSVASPVNAGLSSTLLTK